MTTLLKIYVETGFLLVVSLLVCRLLARLVTRQVVSARATDTLRAARLVFAATLAAPLVVRLLPVRPLIDAAAGWLRAGSAMNSVSPRDALPTYPAWDTVWQATPIADFLARPAWVGAAVALLSIAVLTGLAVGLFRLGLRVLRLRRLVDDAVPLRVLGGVQILVSTETPVPFSTVIFGRALVVLPVDLLRDHSNLSLVIRHELQHLRTWDGHWAVALELFRIAFFWNPAAPGWVRELLGRQELACDEVLIRRGISPASYARCLVRVAEMIVGGRDRVVAATAMAPVRTGSRGSAQLQRRIDMLFRDPLRTTSRRWLVAGAVAFAVLLTLGAAYPPAEAWPPTGAPADRAVADAAVHDHDCGDSGPVDCPDRADCPKGVLGEAGAPGCAGTDLSETPARDLEFKTPAGETFRLSDLRGQVVLIDFWASWCRPCHDEIEHLKKIHEELSGEGLRVVGVSIDREPDELREFIDQHEVPWAQHFAGGWNHAVMDAFGIKAIPSHILVDRSGRWMRLPLEGPDALTGAVLQMLEAPGGEAY